MAEQLDEYQDRCAIHFPDEYQFLKDRGGDYNDDWEHYYNQLRSFHYPTKPHDSDHFEDEMNDIRTQACLDAVKKGSLKELIEAISDLDKEQFGVSKKQHGIIDEKPERNQPHAAMLDQKDARGRSLLWWAIKLGHQDMVEYFKEQVNDFYSGNKEDRNGRTKLYMDCIFCDNFKDLGKDLKNVNESEVEKLTEYAAIYGNKTVLATMLSVTEGDSQEKKFAKNVLASVVGFGTSKTLEYIINKTDNGLDTDYLKTAYECAFWFGDIEKMQYLERVSLLDESEFIPFALSELEKQRNNNSPVNPVIFQHIMEQTLSSKNKDLILQSTDLIMPILDNWSEMAQCFLDACSGHEKTQLKMEQRQPKKEEKKEESDLEEEELVLEEHESDLEEQVEEMQEKPVYKPMEMVIPFEQMKSERDKIIKHLKKVFPKFDFADKINFDSDDVDEIKTAIAKAKTVVHQFKSSLWNIIFHPFRSYHRWQANKLLGKLKKEWVRHTAESLASNELPEDLHLHVEFDCVVPKHFTNKLVQAKYLQMKIPDGQLLVEQAKQITFIEPDPKDDMIADRTLGKNTKAYFYSQLFTATMGAEDISENTRAHIHQKCELEHAQAEAYKSPVVVK